MRKGLLLLSFILIKHICYGQKLDSLNEVVLKSKKDTNQVKTLREISYYYLFERGDIDKSLEFTDKAIALSKKIKSYYWCGKLYSLKAYIKQNFTTDFQESIKYNFTALRNFDKAKKDQPKIAVYINLGTQYFYYGQYDDAEKYLKLGLEIAKKYKAEEDIAILNSNLGSVYNEMQKNDLALFYLNEAKKYYEKSGNESDLARIEFSIINIEASNPNISNSMRRKAISIYKKVIPIFKKNNTNNFLIGAYSNLAIEYKALKEMDSAYKYLKISQELAEADKDYVRLYHVYYTLADYYKKNGDYKEESNYLLKLIQVKDTLFNHNKDRAVSEVQIKYQTEKIEADNALLQKNSEIKDLEISKKDIEISQSNTIKFALLGGLTLIIVFTAFLYNRFKITNQQKKTIEQQKLLVEIKQKEITDSIKYAQRLQEAILPSREIIKKYLPDSFLLYKPKDIVAGDFYFFEVENDTIFIAAADCTGHGVPGAMVSVVCSNALHRSIKEFGITDPGKILDKTRELVVQTFEKSGQDVKDGMDIAICAIKNNNLQFAGANNPCWILRGEDYIVLPADKQPIGKFEKSFPYSTKIAELREGDQLYIFTDGYNDQFGGKEGKKFKAKNFYKLLKTIQYLKMEDQKREIDMTFEKWKGNLEQIDDVCLIGIRI